MESDDFAVLPGGIFTRSFIRSYAKYLGLDDEQVIAEYQLTAPPKDLELSRLKLSSASSMTRSGRRSFLLPTLLAVVMVAGAYSIFRYAHRAEEVPAAAPGSEIPESTPQTTSSEKSSPAPGSTRSPSESSPAAVQAAHPTSAADSVGTGGESAQPNPPSQTGSIGQPQVGVSSTKSGTRPAADTIADGEIVLQLAATPRVWVSAHADGRTELQRTLNPQDVSTVKAKDHFDVMTGNAQGLVLTLNGETLKPLGRAGEVRKVHLTRSSARPDSP